MPSYSCDASSADSLTEELQELLLRVPYFRQTSPLNCGPTCLRMATATFSNLLETGARSVEDCDTAAGLQEGKITETLGLALGLSRLLPGEVDVVFSSSHPGFNAERMQQQYYRKYSANTESAHRAQLAEAEELGIVVETRSVALDEMRKWLGSSTSDDPRLIICLLDWSQCTMSPPSGYSGHYVLLVAFHRGRAVFHNPQRGGAGCSLPEAAFDRARRAEGTDEVSPDLSLQRAGSRRA